ncbi:MAG: RNA-guided endonuclease InsQ/TnpB family protein [Candidatus Heimdallarchaeota archaeon]
MRVQRGYKYELNVNNCQITLLKKHAGASRFTYNWGLAQRQVLYRNNTGKDRYTNAIKQHRLLNSLKKNQFPWMYDVSKCAPQEALRDLDKAYHNFFMSIKKGERGGFPKFKKKGRSIDSFRLTGTIKIAGNRIQLPRLGKLKMKGKNHVFNGRILSATVSNQHNRWYVSVLVEEEITAKTNSSTSTIGVDVGINKLAYLSNGKVFENPRHMKSKIRKLKRLSRFASRKKRGSSNQKKAYERLNNFHYRTGNQRRNTLNHLTKYLSSNFTTVVIEDLKVANMMRNRKLAFSLQDAGFGEFKRQMEYKCQWKGVNLILADTFFPSSKLCNNCGQKKDIDLSVRTYSCECGYSCDRDYNASKNLEDYPIFNKIRKLTGKWVVPTDNKTVVASEFFLHSRRKNVSRLKTPDGENVRSADLSNDVGTVLDETGNEHRPNMSSII